MFSHLKIITYFSCFFFVSFLKGVFNYEFSCPGIQEGVCITLDGARVAPLGETRFTLALRGGQLYVLTLLSDSVRSVRSFHLDRAAASVLTSCVSFLFYHD